MKKPADQHSGRGVINPRSEFFSEFRELVPEAFEDLKSSSLDKRNKMCRALVLRGIKMDQTLKSEPVNTQLYLRGMLIRLEYLERGDYQKIKSEYYESLRDWARRWNLGEDQWEWYPKWIVDQAEREIDSMLNPAIVLTSSEYDATRGPVRILQYGDHEEGIRIEYSPEEAERLFGQECRDYLESTGNTWEETVELICVPKAEEIPELTLKLNSRLAEIREPASEVYFAANVPDFFYPDFWDPLIESRAKATKRIKSEFNKYLKAYFDEKQEYVKGKSGEPFPSILNRKRREEMLLFEWLILNHIQGWSKSRIAKQAEVDRKAVQQSIKKKAPLIGLRTKE